MSTDQQAQSINAKLNTLLDFEQIPDLNALLSQLKQYLCTSQNYLEKEFKKGTNIRKLVQARARHIDKMLVALWRHLGLDLEHTNQLALIAVGGYGRGELHPYSDIDLLVLSEGVFSAEQKSRLEQFISLLWDCHLKVGQSVRDLNQCLQLAKQDVTITTNIMESRLLVGNQVLFHKIKRLTSPDNIWEPRAFFQAKTDEQKARYRKFDGSSFDLEPNIKSSPGGLRDIHLTGWVAQRIYYPKTLHQLIRQNVITKKEYYTLVKSQLFLWRVRFALHLVSGKAEDRLLFDYQKNTATMMGFKDSENTLAVEKMMKRYYRAVRIIRNISDILLQTLEQLLVSTQKPDETQPVDEDFQIVNHRIDAIDLRCFIKKPSLLLKVFQYVARDNSIIGITAPTMRAIRAARYKITPTFRNNKNNKQLFVEFWHIPHTSSRAMFLMKRSGVLADYLKVFRQISGQMQYDMFHNYTVDEHTLFLLKNLCEFADPNHNDAFPICSKIMQRQKYPEIIFLAGLFHDIGKGRGGDHSELGAIEARKFCIQHKIPEKHGKLIEWLVANHLLMSLVAQKRDTSDPKVINNFAELVINEQHLELLYILTVADIRATSNSLWNSWKDSLLKNLYLHTSEFLQRESTDIEQVWKSNRIKAKNLLVEQGLDSEIIESLWQHLDKQYFSKRSPEAIAWQTSKILSAKKDKTIIVGIKSTPNRSGSEVFVYSEDKENLFATLTATLNQKGLHIQAANIFTDKNGYCYDSFFVLDEQGNALKSQQIKNGIKEAIIHNITNINEVNLSVQRRMPRQFKYFTIPTKVEFFEDEYSGYTRMELTAPDSSGLLAAIGEAFKSTGVKLHDARITTLGEKVEDTFIISHHKNLPINDKQQQQCIRHAIMQQLDK